jgi:uncharacterized coiled-coil protein SlyX
MSLPPRKNPTPSDLTTGTVTTSPSQIQELEEKWSDKFKLLEMKVTTTKDQLTTVNTNLGQLTTTVTTMDEKMNKLTTTDDQMTTVDKKFEKLELKLQEQFTTLVEDKIQNALQTSI